MRYELSHYERTAIKPMLPVDKPRGVIWLGANAELFGWVLIMSPRPSWTN
jgi:hypothetical protein